MKSIKITYHCDYCKKLIDQDSDTVMAIMPGRIGYQDSFIPDQDDKVQHYHDYCLEHILALDYSTEFPEDKSLDALDKQKEEPEPVSFKEMLEPVSKPETEKPEKLKKNYDSPHKDDYYGPVKKGVKDLGALKSLLNAGWSQKEIAGEFGVAPSTITAWKKELEGGGQK